MEKEEYGDEIRNSLQVVTPLDLVLQPNFTVDEAKCAMDLLIGQYKLDPKIKTQFTDGTFGKSLQDSVFEIILSRGLRKKYHSLSAKLDYLFFLTKSFSLKKLMKPLAAAENDIVTKAIASEERQEWEQWHPQKCSCKRCKSHNNMLAGKPFDEDDIHDYDHPHVWAEYNAFQQKTVFFDRHTAFIMQSLV